MAKHKDKQHTEPEGEAPRPEHAAVDDYSPEGYESLIAERDDFRSRYQRALADYQNTQRRLQSDMAAAREAGVERVLASILPVLDHFDLALDQDPAKVSAEQILSGVIMIRDEFTKALQAFGITAIDPRPNEEFDPQQHEALSQVGAEGVEPGRVSSVYQVGYRINDRVIRAAKVTIAPASEGEN